MWQCLPAGDRWCLETNPPRVISTMDIASLPVLPFERMPVMRVWSCSSLVSLGLNCLTCLSRQTVRDKTPAAGFLISHQRCSQLSH